MKIYNKFVESKKEPSNKSDIWFDGSSWNMYKEGMWRPFTISLEQAQALYRYVEDFKLFKIVNGLPEVGQDNTIYLIENKDSIEGNSLIEYIYINNKWEEVGKFTPEINLDDYAKKSDIVQSDYNQNDTTAKDYIKNRTHYENDILICYNETIKYNNPFIYTLKNLSPIIINWKDPDGAKFETILNESNNYTAVVDGYDCTLDASVDKDTLILTVKETYGSGSIQKTYITQKEIKELDEQYIPSTIARQSEITRLENRIKELENIISQITIKIE